MLPLAPRFQSPVHQALWSAGLIVVFALVVWLIWGVVDPEMRSWSLLGLAPVMGLFTYLQATGRHRLIAISLMGIGLGGLLFWAIVLISGAKPITGRADYAYIAFILLVPVGCFALGWMMLRRLRPRSPSATP